MTEKIKTEICRNIANLSPSLPGDKGERRILKPSTISASGPQICRGKTYILELLQVRKVAREPNPILNNHPPISDQPGGGTGLLVTCVGRNG